MRRDVGGAPPTDEGRSMNPLLGEELLQAADAKRTLTGRPIPPLQAGLPKTVESVVAKIKGAE